WFYDGAKWFRQDAGTWTSDAPSGSLLLQAWEMRLPVVQGPLLVITLASGLTVRLFASAAIAVSDLTGGLTDNPDGTFAAVTPHPTQANVLGITNSTRSNWTATTPDGPRTVEPGRSLSIQDGTTVMFGQL